ncbi:proton-coupled folate transporter-like [Argiope bruennichi]|uniref:proton-coupled folate transporter-like n=1 Tax=Argiope bruennichi TaxID=94029 RepID=UPI0024950A26|nr:proton-coupled folate transporter-like [Argiope bruennichi]
MESRTEKNESKILSALKDMVSNITVEPYLFFCHVAYIMRMIPFQDLLMDRSCRNTFEYGNDICSDLKNHNYEKERVVAAGNDLYTWVMLISSLPAAIVAIFLGPWSDKYTRKYPMIIAASGLFLESLANTILTIFPKVNPTWYVVCGIFGGISGGFLVCISSAFSYVSDVTNERTRAGRFAIIEFANLSALVVGNLLGGQIYKKFGYLEVFVVCPICYGVAILYTIIFIKETKPPVPPENRLQMATDLLRLDNIKQSYITCSKKRPGNLRFQILLLFLIGTWQRFTDLGSVAIAFPFAKKMYDWDVTDISNANIIFYTVMALLTVLVLPFLSNRLKLHEAALGLIGMLSQMSKMLVASLAYKDFMFYFAWLSGCLNNAGYISVRARLSKLVHKEEVGSIFSLLGTCESFTPLLGSTVFLQMFNVSGFFPGLPFALGGLSLIPCAFAFIWMTGLPTVSLSDYGREEDGSKVTPLETITSSSYSKLEEEKF